MIFSLLTLFIFVIRNKNEPKNARPAKLATLKQYRGFLLTHYKPLLFPIYFDAFALLVE